MIEAWNQKENRDYLREELATKTIENLEYTLCFYNGKEKETLTDALAYSSLSNFPTVAKDKPVIIFSVYNQSSVVKVKLSEINYISEVENLVKTALYSSSEKNIAIKENLSIIEQTAAKDFNITSDGKTVYFIDDVSEKTGHGDVYKMNISGNKVQKPELYDSDVYTGDIINDKFIYLKDVKNSKGELYVDKTKVDYDVDMYSYSYDEETDTMVYFVDWNEEKNYGTLKMFKNGKSVKIADDVYDYRITPSGEILYLYDYSTKYYKGELFIYKNNKAEKIDDEVISIIPVYDLEYRGSTYGW